MSDGSISQSELDTLFGGLEEIKDDPKEQHIWIVKSQYSVFGGRNYSFWQAQQLLAKVQKENLGIRLEIKQIK